MISSHRDCLLRNLIKLKSYLIKVGQESEETIVCMICSHRDCLLCNLIKLKSYLIEVGQESEETTCLHD